MAKRDAPKLLPEINPAAALPDSDGTTADPPKPEPRPAALLKPGVRRATLSQARQLHASA